MITQAITDLAKARDTVKVTERHVESARAVLELTEEWNSLQECQANLQRAREAESKLDGVVRAIALEQFRTNNTKSVHPAVSIKMFKRFIYDARQALDYAREHIPNALKLDVRAFEKAAQALGLDFVAVEDDPRPQIASDLSEYAK